MNNVITVDFKKKPKPYNADVYTHYMCIYRIETDAISVHDACIDIVSIFRGKEINIKCVVIYSGLTIDRKDTDDVLLTYFPKKDACNE